MLRTLSWESDSLSLCLIPYKVHLQAWLLLFWQKHIYTGQNRWGRRGGNLEFLTFNCLFPVTAAVLSSVKGKQGGGSVILHRRKGEQVVPRRWEYLCLFGVTERTGDIFGCSECICSGAGAGNLSLGERDVREHLGWHAPGHMGAKRLLLVETGMATCSFHFGGRPLISYRKGWSHSSCWCLNVAQRVFPPDPAGVYSSLNE